MIYTFNRKTDTFGKLPEENKRSTTKELVRLQTETDPGINKNYRKFIYFIENDYLGCISNNANKPNKESPENCNCIIF